MFGRTGETLNNQLVRQRESLVNSGASQNINGRVTRELDYVTANRFYVEMESQITACFTECQGLGVKVKYERYLEGGVNDQQRIMLGQPEFSDVTLKRGVTDDLVFLDWLSDQFTQLIDRNQDRPPLRANPNLELSPPQPPDRPPRIVRRNVNILLFNQAGETVQCWTLIGAVPVGWKAPSMQANSNAVAIEELTLAYEGLKVANLTSQGMVRPNRIAGGGASALTSGRDLSGYFESQ